MPVRLAQPTDLEDVARLRAALWPEGSIDEHRDEARAVLAGRPPGDLPLVNFVATDGGRLIGFVEVGLRSHADGCDPARPCGFVEGWYVAPEHRRRGVGRALIRAAEDWARGQGCTELASDTWIDNEVSQHAHAALGFELVDRCVNYRKPISGAPASSSAAHYGADLARVHHEYFGHVADSAARELLARLRQAGFSSGTVVDLAAGSGILSHAAAEAGFQAWGVELSDDMLRLARVEAPKATFVKGSLWTADLPDCVAVAVVGEALGYTADPAAGLSALETRLVAFHDALAPGGVLLFDFAGPGRSGRDRCRRTFSSFPGVDLGFTEVEETQERRLTRTITLFIGAGATCRREQETHVLHLYAPEDVERLLTAAGFDWERLHGYGDLQLVPGWHAYAGIKRRR